ncbi:MAG: hypothetical protein ACR2Q3_13275 [Woeseiaceae bacterium]
MKLALTQDAATRSPGPTIEEFEALEIDPERFNHRSHVFVAWSYLRDLDLISSIDRYRSTLKRLTRKLGVPGKYHETITWFFMILVAERIERDPPGEWGEFVERNPDLFASKPGIIETFYTSARINSAAARHQFLLPDRVND